MKVTTKWGKIQINIEKIVEVNIRISPWDNVYMLEFYMEDAHSPVHVELPSLNELTRLVTKINRELSFVMQYKSKSPYGGTFIDEGKRLSLGQYKEED